MLEMITELESDGTLTIVSPKRAGYRSAHRIAAVHHLGRSARRSEPITWVNRNGVHVVLTQWARCPFTSVRGDHV